VGVVRSGEGFSAARGGKGGFTGKRTGELYDPCGDARTGQMSLEECTLGGLASAVEAFYHYQRTAGGAHGVLFSLWVAGEGEHGG